MDMGKGSFTADLAPKEAPAPWVTIPTVAEFWGVGPSYQVAKKGPATSSRAQGAVPVIQAESAPLAKTDEQLAHQL